MANRLSDEELRKSIQAYGEVVGPITPTTRSVWERRLALLKRSNGSPSASSALNAFSSDDSEIENSVSSRVRRKKTYSKNETTERLERLSLTRPHEINSSPERETFKRPSPVHIPVPGQETKSHSETPNHYRNLNLNRKVKKNLGKQSTFDVETSDSDFDVESPFMPTKSPRLRKKLSTSNLSTDLLSVKLRKPHEGGINNENTIKRNWRPDAPATIRRFNPVLDKINKEHVNEGYRTNGYVSNTVSNGDFCDAKVQGSSTNYSHCVSWLLVLGAVAFFVIIGALYMTEVQKTTQTTNKSYSKFCSGVKEEQCKSLILVSRELHQLLTTVAGEYECDSSGVTKSRNLTAYEAREILQKQFSEQSSFEMKDFDFIFNHSVFLIWQNPSWGIKLYSIQDFNSELSEYPPDLDSSALEAKLAAKSFWCRIRHSLRWTATKLFLLLFIVLLVFVSYIAWQFWKKWRETQEKLFYAMVEKIIDILQEPQESDSHLGPYKAVVNIRDTVLPPKERKSKLWLWEKVVSFIEENESRVSVEYKKINGEDFKVWRWNPCTAPEGEASKQGKVWQGQAFNSLGKGKQATYSPTPCLKIRNMFDSEVEYGDDWQISIQDAILEKCEGNNGIRHIAVDPSSNEGCVYMLCTSTEAAGKAFNALHGWWFDSKLVTVKYLRYERYLERFPESKNCVEPLKPSNNKRLSLSTPFFCSVLETS